ncbi:MAG: molybdopterin-synthase adenylyltransferase MoeB [Acidiferrobacterales bacterium]|jgi:molybdopterin/thiamine biosynthesis adenylyltransferase|nr:molybdopterin-synthase adenylyltransferase MoeB [Acidiferrobacterales bacterium]
MTLNDEQLLRYSRQIMLPNVDVAGQERLLASRVLIVGIGGLGAPVAMYLAASGVGHLALADHDTVELSNLQRQIIHDSDSLGMTKVASAAGRLAKLNPGITVSTIDHKMSRDELVEQAHLADVIVDATDNFETRFLLNEVSVQQQTPLVSGAAIRTEGQISVFVPGDDQPCYRCLYHEGPELEETCSENGVLSPLVGIIGSIQAMETVKLLLGIGDALVGRLLVLDALQMEWRTIRLKKDPACPVCGNRQAGK